MGERVGEGRAGVRICGSVAWAGALGERREDAFGVKAHQGLDPRLSRTPLRRTRRQAGCRPSSPGERAGIRVVAR